MSYLCQACGHTVQVKNPLKRILILRADKSIEREIAACPRCYDGHKAGMPLSHLAKMGEKERQAPALTQPKDTVNVKTTVESGGGSFSSFVRERQASLKRNEQSIRGSGRCDAPPSIPGEQVRKSVPVDLEAVPREQATGRPVKKNAGNRTPGKERKGHNSGNARQRPSANRS
jgi:DNA-directed RNA polymerase subunit RPC12/RpoP